MILGWLLACSAPSPGPRAAVAADPPIRVAVVLGYDPSDRARAAEAGARAFAERLERAGWRVEALIGQRATPENAAALIGSLASVPGHTPSPEDRFLVYVQAHGERTRALGDALAPAVRLSSGAATVAGLVAAIDQAPILHKVLILDSCFPSLDGVSSTVPLAPRATLVLTAAGADEAAGAVVGQGGVYTECLLEGWQDGSLLATHRSAEACVAARRPGQHTRAYPPAEAVFDVALGDKATPLSALLDGLTPTLPPGARVSMDGQDLSETGGLVLRGDRIQHRFAITRDGLEIARLVREWPPGLLGLQPAPEGSPGPDWLRLSPEARPRDPQYREVAVETGLVDAVGPGLFQGAAAVSLDGARTGWFVLKREGPPVYVVNVAPSGETPRYEAADLGLSSLPRSAYGGPPFVLDLDQDGQPEVCYASWDQRMVCVGSAGPWREAPLPDRPVVFLLGQADLDGDGDLDLLLRSLQGLEVWAWEGEARRYALAADLGPGAVLDRGGLLDLDGDGQSDLLVSDRGGSVEARFFGLRGRGSPWATAISGELLGLRGHVARTLVTGLDGVRSLIVTEAEHDDAAIYPVGRLQLGPPWRGPSPAGDGEIIDLAAGDLDLDGATDLVYMHRDLHQPPHRLFLRRPSLGGWRRLQDVPGLDLSTDDQDVILDDVDQDGDLDVLALHGDELAGVPPDGCGRLFLSDAADHANRLTVDLATGGRPIVGAEVALQGSPRGPVQLSGGQTTGAAIFGLGAGGVPGALTVRWPDGASETVRDPARFVAEPGGWRVRLARSSALSGRLLVGRWIVDLGAPPEARVRAAEGLPDVIYEAWPTPSGAAVWAEGDRPLYVLDQEGRRRQAPVPGYGCSWGGYVGGALNALLLSCSELRQDGYTERLHLWRPGRAALSAPIEGAPTYARGLALDGDRLWIAWGRRRVEARAATPALSPLGISLPAPEGAIDRTFVYATSEGQVLVLDEGADRVEVWSGDPLALQRLVPTGDAKNPPDWDPMRRVWLVPVEGGVEAIDPRRDAPVARWDVPGIVGGVLSLENGDIAVLMGGGDPGVRVLGEPGEAPKMIVSLPPFGGRVFLRLSE